MEEEVTALRSEITQARRSANTDGRRLYDVVGPRTVARSERLRAEGWARSV